MKTFIQWIEALGDNIGMWIVDGEGEGLHEPEGLAYIKPKIPDEDSPMMKRIKKLFGHEKEKKEKDKK